MPTPNWDYLYDIAKGLQYNREEADRGRTSLMEAFHRLQNTMRVAEDKLKEFADTMKKYQDEHKPRMQRTPEPYGPSAMDEFFRRMRGSRQSAPALPPPAELPLPEMHKDFNVTKQDVEGVPRMGTVYGYTQAMKDEQPTTEKLKDIVEQMSKVTSMSAQEAKDIVMKAWKAGEPPKHPNVRCQLPPMEFHTFNTWGHHYEETPKVELFKTKNGYEPWNRIASNMLTAKAYVEETHEVKFTVNPQFYNFKILGHLLGRVNSHSFFGKRPGTVKLADTKYTMLPPEPGDYYCLARVELKLEYSPRGFTTVMLHDDLDSGYYSEKCLASGLSEADLRYIYPKRFHRRRKLMIGGKEFPAHKYFGMHANGRTEVSVTRRFDTEKDAIKSIQQSRK